MKAINDHFQHNYDIWSYILKILYYQNDYCTILNLRNILYTFVTHFFKQKLPHLCVDMTNFGQNLQFYLTMRNNVFSLTKTHIILADTKTQSYLFEEQFITPRNFSSQLLRNSYLNKSHIYVRCRNLANENQPIFISENCVLGGFSYPDILGKRNGVTKMILWTLGDQITILFDESEKNNIWMISKKDTVFISRIISFVSSKKLSAKKKKLIFDLMKENEKISLLFWTQNSNSPQVCFSETSASGEENTIYTKYIRCKNLRIARVVDKMAGILTTEDSMENQSNTYRNWLDIISKKIKIHSYEGMTECAVSSLIGSLFDTGKFKYSVN